MKTYRAVDNYLRVAVLLPFLFTACCFSLVSQEPSDPEKNFEHLWQTFDRDYALFSVKGVDWDALYRIYRPQVSSNTTDDKLFQIMSSMLGHLNDNHVRLRSDDPTRHFSAGYLHQHFGGDKEQLFRKLMSQRPLPSNYRLKDQQVGENGIFFYGWLATEVGYIHFNSFRNIAGSRQMIDQIIQFFEGAKSIIVDVRRNGGGDDRVGKLIADRFADEKRLYMTTQNRSGEGHSDFDEKKYWYLEPDGPLQFTKQVILLTDRTSISAAENFTLAMRVLPHVTVVGDLTSGCFADAYSGKLPNGWQFGCSYNLFLDPTGFCWEGLGVRPDLLAINKLEKNMDQDNAIELALALLTH